jgi:hypothetical protein
MTVDRAVQDHIAVALHSLRQAEIAALTLPTDVDEEAVPHITQAISNAHHELRGAFYALAALGNSIAGHP